MKLGEVRDLPGPGDYGIGTSTNGNDPRNDDEPLSSDGVCLLCNGEMIPDSGGWHWCAGCGYGDNNP